MKVSQLRIVLLRSADLVASDGRSELAAGLRALAATLQAGDAEQVGQVLKIVRKRALESR